MLCGCVVISAVLSWIVVYLTHLDYQDTERIMTEKLQNQVNGTEWSWKNLNTVSSNLIIVTYTALFEKVQNIMWFITLI